MLINVKKRIALKTCSFLKNLEDDNPQLLPV